jgi:hypothetical protein
MVGDEVRINEYIIIVHQILPFLTCPFCGNIAEVDITIL